MNDERYFYQSLYSLYDYIIIKKSDKIKKSKLLINEYAKNRDQDKFEIIRNDMHGEKLLK